MSEVAAVIAVGLLAGLLSGMLGVGGGVLFVPALAVVLDLSQLEAEATSLVAIVPVAIVGAWRQHLYGNCEVRDGVLIGCLALAGSAAGVAVANSVPERALEVAFAVLLLGIAARMIAGAARA